MCGIAGFLSLRGDRAPVGAHLLRMLMALADRGPDSAGVAAFTGPRDTAPPDESSALKLRVKLPEEGSFEASAAAIVADIGACAQVLEFGVQGAYLQIEVAGDSDLQLMTRMVERSGAAEVISAGHRLEIIKQVGSPQRLEDDYGISRLTGTHGIGHTRLSTESRIDLSHSQPFWAHGVPDMAIVHNGHVTNYHKLRRCYEERGVHFYTENDSEIIGIYLADRLSRGDSLEEALQRSLRELDGSYCYLAATDGALAYVKDAYSFKPLVVAETDEWIAIATEEIALRRALGDDFEAMEPAAGRMQLWQVPTLIGSAL